MLALSYGPTRRDEASPSACCSLVFQGCVRTSRPASGPPKAHSLARGHVKQTKSPSPTPLPSPKHKRSSGQALAVPPRSSRRTNMASQSSALTEEPGPSEAPQSTGAAGTVPAPSTEDEEAARKARAAWAKDDSPPPSATMTPYGPLTTSPLRTVEYSSERSPGHPRFVPLQTVVVQAQRSAAPAPARPAQAPPPSSKEYKEVGELRVYPDHVSRPSRRKDV